jgi:glycosyltransferase involved in cell wall biosynthesis
LSDDKVLQSLHRIEAGILGDPDLSSLYQESKTEDGVTIFIPNWNHRPYLPRAIHSALCAVGCLREAGFSAEILVIDDASRDGSQKLLRSLQMLYEEPRLKTLSLKQNLGLPRLRNLALQMSRFRYVCMMDADNELVPDNLPLFLRSIIETGAALVHGNLIAKTQGEEVVRLWSSRVATMRLTRNNYIDAFALVDVRKLLRVGGYTSNPRLYGYEDWEMVLHLISEEEMIVFVPVVMGYYHRNPGSMLQETLQKAERKTGSRSEGLPLEDTKRSEEARALMRRMFAQTGTREWDPVRVGYIYHPAVGWIDQW